MVHFLKNKEFFQAEKKKSVEPKYGEFVVSAESKQAGALLDRVRVLVAQVDSA